MAGVEALIVQPGSTVVTHVTMATAGGSLLEPLQAAIGGWIEAVPVGEVGTMYIDEEGKLKGRAVNVAATWLIERSGTRLQTGDLIVGTAVIVGPADSDGYDTSVPTAVLELLGPDLQLVDAR